MKQSDQLIPEEEQKTQRAAIFRVYNYYRILISFLFLFLFLDPNLNAFVGNINPELFTQTIIGYITLNVIIGIATLFISVNFLSRITPALIVVIGDILALILLMSSSGGVTSGLGNFLFFTLAFSGSMIHGRVSTVLPAIAFILTIYGEFYLFFLDENDVRSFFLAGILGIVYFVANILFQTLSNQLRIRQSEVYRLEQINQSVIESMRTGVIVLTDNNQARLMNQSASKFLHSAETEPLPKPLLDAAMSWKEGPLGKQTTINTGKNELIATFSPLKNDSNDADDTLIFLEDSTELQRQAQQLKLASLGRLSASIAHEIRNPLGAISHAAQLLQESTDLDKGDRRLCEIVQDHSVRLNAVIENVLQMSRRKAPEKMPINLDGWLREFVLDFSLCGENPTIELFFDTPSTTINADPFHLNQVLSNLCQNGLRYSKKKTGEAKVLIRVGKDPEDHFAYLEIIDFGDGVSLENIDNLFEPFYTTEAKGTGLGLYLSRELCAANEAQLTYETASEGGGSFRVSFLS